MNIATDQITKTRTSLRSYNGEIIIGKNSLAKLAINILTSDEWTETDYPELKKKYGSRPNLKNLLPFIKGKIGFVFCDEDYITIKPIIEKEIIKQAAKEGVVAPSSIFL